MRKLQRLGTFGWFVALVAGLGLLVVVSPCLGGGGPTSGVPLASTVQQAGDLERSTTNTEEPAVSDSFLRNYDALVHDQAIVTSRSPAIGDAVGFLAKFGLILVLLYGSLRALRGFMLRQQGMTAAAQIEILETRYLSSNRALYLVGAGPKVLLLGGTDQQITFLAELADVDLEVGEWKMENGGGKTGNGKGEMEGGR